MSKRAIILAGGKGTRLRPYTVVLPKPLMPLGDYPILEIIVRQLAAEGFSRITLAVNHQANIIKAFFGNGSKWNVELDYSLEEKPLSTIAPLCLIPDLPDDFLLMNGDVLTDLDLNSFFNEHVQEKRLFTVSASRRVHTIDYGVLEVNESDVLTTFKEKPSVEYLVSMGIYAVNKSVLSLVPPEQAYGFDDLMRDLLLRSTPVKVQPYEGYWLDIGRPDDYVQAIEDFDERRARLLRHA
jgi:NDP-mannose synthase